LSQGEDPTEDRTGGPEADAPDTALPGTGPAATT